MSSLPVAGRLAVVEEADRVLVVSEDDPSDWLCAFAKADGFPGRALGPRHGAHLQRAAGAQSNIQPPSTSSVWPLTKLAVGAAKNAIASATSSTSPLRLIDWASSTSRQSSSWSAWISVAAVGKAPGATALTRMPSGPASRASARVKPMTAPFDAT